MLLLPIKVNNRTNYMVDFESSRQVTDSFVIDASIEGVLFEFNSGTQDGGGVKMGHHAATSILFQNSKEQTGLYINGLDYNKNENLLEISLTNGKPATMESQELKFPEWLSYNSQDLSFHFGLINETINLCVRFCYESHSRKVDFFLAPASQIVDAVIDSGSEATQIGIFKRGEEISVDNIIPILDETLVHFNIDSAEYKPNSFIQAEVEGDACDLSLFRTRFFVKNSISRGEINAESHLPKGGDDPILRMLVTPEMLDNDDMKNAYIQLYNMKIASFGGVELPKIRKNGHLKSIAEAGANNFYYRKYLNVFLHEILSSVCDDDNWENNDETNNKKLLSLYVLMPNVYTPKKAQECLDYIRKDLKSIIDRDETFKDVIVGFDVTAVSESDASLVGAKSMSVEVGSSPGTYLIMDAGKGTLDFSIAELDEKGILKNKMKSGIVGGSAAISYGFLLDLLQTYLNERQIEIDDIKTFIFANILGKTSDGTGVGGGDLCFLNNLMNEVDAYKIRYDSLKNPYLVEEHTDFDSSFKLDAFVEWINSCNAKIETPNVVAIIETIIKYTVAKIAASLKEGFQIDNVVYAGRGFLFEPLKSGMRKALKLKFPDIQEKTFVSPEKATNNKNVCLFISRAISGGEYNHQQLSEPRLLDSVTVAAIDTGAIVNPNDISKPTLTETLLAVWNQLSGGIRDVTSSGAAHTEALSAGDKTPFAHGHDIKSAPNQYYAIGGHFYHLGPNVPQGKARVFQSNGRIYIRYESADKVEQLTEIPNLTVELAFPSLFPFCDVSRSGDIYLPHVSNESAADESSSATEKKKTLGKTEVVNKTENPQYEASAGSNEETIPNQDKDAVLEKLKTQTGVNKK